MARRSKTVMDMYKRKEKDRKKRGADIGSTVHTGIGVIGVLFYLGIVLAVVAIIILFFFVGIFALIIGGIIATIIIVIRSRKKRKNDIESLLGHLEKIEENKKIANSSNDYYEVKRALDELIESIDFILLFDEKFLNKIGMSKKKLPEQKDFIIKNYDAVLKETRH